MFRSTAYPQEYTRYKKRGMKISKNTIGILWFVLSLMISVLNDVISKQLGSVGLTPMQVSFGRFFFGTIVLFALLCCYAISNGSRCDKDHIKNSKANNTTSSIGFIGVLRTPNMPIHCLRGGGICAAIYLWNYGIQLVPLATVTSIAFTAPIFTLVLARLFLKEHVSWQMWVLTIFGFIGIIVILDPGYQYFQLSLVSFVLATALFAALDIINKKLINLGSENTFAMMFYSTLFGAIFSLYPSLYGGFTIPSNKDMLLLALLGGFGSNAILYCLLRAFECTKASYLAPIRYLEMPISALCGYAMFGEMLTIKIYLGAAIIAICSFFAVHCKKFIKYHKSHAMQKH